MKKRSAKPMRSLGDARKAVGARGGKRGRRKLRSTGDATRVSRSR